MISRGALQSTPRGTLRVYTGTHIVPFLSPVVTEFLKTYPDVKVDLTMGERSIDLIDEGYDIAVRLTPAPGFEPDRPQPCDLAACPVLFTRLSRKNIRGHSNCLMSRGIIACAMCFIRSKTSGISSIAGGRRPRCGSPVI